MKRSTAVVGLALAALGAALLLEWLPGSASMAPGPRVGMGLFLTMVAALIFGLPGAGWFLRRTTHASDYEGGCPVGSRCACGTFNLKPRTQCRDCGSPTAWS